MMARSRSVWPIFSLSAIVEIQVYEWQGVFDERIALLLKVTTPERKFKWPVNSRTCCDSGLGTTHIYIGRLLLRWHPSNDRASCVACIVCTEMARMLPVGHDNENTLKDVKTRRCGVTSNSNRMPVDQLRAGRYGTIQHHVWSACVVRLFNTSNIVSIAFTCSWKNGRVFNKNMTHFFC